MKKLMIVFTCLVMVLGLCFVSYGQEEKEVLKTYEAVTGECEVETLEEVIVEEIVIIEKRTPWTLEEVNNAIDYYGYFKSQAEAQLKGANEAIEAMEKMKLAIEKEASTVKLKPLESEAL